MSKKKDKPLSTFGTVFAIATSVTLAPILVRRFKDARAKGDKLATADAAVSGAALAVGVLKALRARKSSGKAED